MVLAPMDDVTDTVFRQVVADCAPPDLFFTEFVNVDGLQSPGRPKLLRKLAFEAKEQPIIAQIWGIEPENFYKTAQELVTMGFAGVDLNFGCPQKSEVKNGTCAALINNRPKAHEIIQATQDGVAGRIPVSAKTRLGYNEVDFSWHEFLLEHSLNMLSVHGRTKKEMSKVPAHWEDIGKIRELRDQLAPKTLIVGNGDVQSRVHARELAEKYGLDGIMIGRGIFHDPFCFAESSSWESMIPRQKLELFRKHIELFQKTWQQGERPIVILNKFCKIYVSGFDGAQELRARLMDCTTTEELLTKLQRVALPATA